jgi:hypothetical protein
MVCVGSSLGPQAVNQQRIQLLCQDPATAPHAQGVLVIDDTGDRKTAATPPTWPASTWGRRQDRQRHRGGDQPVGGRALLLAAASGAYTPASRLAKGKRDPGFRTKPKLAAELVAAAQQAKIPFRAVVVDCLDGDNTGLVEALGRAGVAFVLALKPARAPGRQPRPPTPQSRPPTSSAGCGPRTPGQWRRVTRRFRDGHTQTWWPRTRCWAAGASGAAPAGGGHHRPERLPKLTTWYLLTNLARPASRRAQQAQLWEVVRLYGLRNWVEQGDRQVKDELGWADFQVRADRAIRRHWTLVCCAFSFAGMPVRPRWPRPGLRRLLPRRRCRRCRPLPGGRAGPSNVAIPTDCTVAVSWPKALRRVRAWLARGCGCSAAGADGRPARRPRSCSRP